MSSLNCVIMMGNLTRTPEVRYTANGTPICTFPLATNRKFKQGDDLCQDTCYIDIVVFGRQAETCGQYLNKGSAVSIEGRLQQRRWETEDGQKRSKHEVVANAVHFMNSDSPLQEEEGQSC